MGVAGGGSRVLASYFGGGLSFGLAPRNRSSVNRRVRTFTAEPDSSVQENRASPGPFVGDLTDSHRSPASQLTSIAPGPRFATMTSAFDPRYVTSASYPAGNSNSVRYVRPAHPLVLTAVMQKPKITPREELMEEALFGAAKRARAAECASSDDCRRQNMLKSTAASERICERLWW